MKEESLSLKNVCKKVGNEISIEKKKLEKEKKDYAQFHSSGPMEK